MGVHFRLKEVSVAFRLVLDAQPVRNKHVAKEARDEGCAGESSLCLCVRLACGHAQLDGKPLVRLARTT